MVVFRSAKVRFTQSNKHRHIGRDIVHRLIRFAHRFIQRYFRGAKG